MKTMFNKLSAILAMVGLISPSIANDRKAFKEGTRVKISAGAPWARGALGTITLPPSNMGEYTKDWGQLRRVFQTPNGQKSSYWVSLDEPLKDSDGDGPFIGGEFDETFLSEAPKSNHGPNELVKKSGHLELTWYKLKSLNLKVEFKAKVLSPTAPQ